MVKPILLALFFVLTIWTNVFAETKYNFNMVISGRDISVDGGTVVVNDASYSIASFSGTLPANSRLLIDKGPGNTLKWTVVDMTTNLPGLERIDEKIKAILVAFDSPDGIVTYPEFTAYIK